MLFYSVTTPHLNFINVPVFRITRSFRPIRGNATVKLEIIGNETVTLKQMVEYVSDVSSVLCYIMPINRTMASSWSKQENTNLFLTTALIIFVVF